MDLFQNISYSKISEIMLVEVYFQNISGIYHIPENLNIMMLSYVSGIFHFVESHIPLSITLNIPGTLRFVVLHKL